MTYDKILKEVAKKNNTNPFHVHQEIKRVIDIGFENPDPEVHARWVQISPSGKKPTPEELIFYIANVCNLNAKIS